MARPAQQAEAQRKLLELQQTGQLAELTAGVRVQLAQININKLDAQGNWFSEAGGHISDGRAALASHINF